jgi:hypothetical protein
MRRGKIVNASSITRRVRKGLVAGCVLSMALVVAPAHAAFTSPPLVQSTSLSANNQWSKINNAVSVDYNRNIDVANSSVVVTDGASLPVSGVVDTPFVIAPVNNVPTRINTAPDVLYFLPQIPFTEEDGPYTATFTARSIGQNPSAASTVVTYTFRVDVKKPQTPSITNLGTPLPRNLTNNIGNTTNPTPAQLQILGSSDDAQLSGLAKDTLDSFGNDDLASGIAKVTLHFYAATSVGYKLPNANNPNPADVSVYATETKQINLLNACTSSLCPTNFAYSAADGTLTAGYWTVRASTTDLAGNVSGQSDPVAFLVVKA